MPNLEEIKNLKLKTILESLSGTECFSCGSRKGAKMSHCRPCYFALPPEMRKNLYNRVGSGYEEAFKESLIFLEERKS